MVSASAQSSVSLLTLDVRSLASWDSPPRADDAGYAAYEKALKRFISARSVTVPARDKKADIVRDGVKWLMKQKFTVDNQPELGQNAQFKLMPFQVDGVNWLCHNWNKVQNCILADEMGLVYSPLSKRTHSRIS